MGRNPVNKVSVSGVLWDIILGELPELVSATVFPAEFDCGPDISLDTSDVTVILLSNRWVKAFCDVLRKAWVVYRLAYGGNQKLVADQLSADSKLPEGFLS